MTVAFAPGRANLIGEHTDYNDGLALPFAVERGVTVRCDPRPGSQVEVVARDLGETDSFDARAPAGAGGWRAYVRGVVAESGVDHGARIEIESTLPRGGGLSSSAALTVALAIALRPDAAGDPLALARLSQRVEAGWAGARTGLLDQLAILLGRSGRAIRIDFRDLTWRHVELDTDGWSLVTVDSGAEHSHAESGYNERRAECRAAAEALGVRSLREATADDASGLPDPLGRRVRHVAGENARVDAAIDALGDGDLERVALLLDESHASLRDLYDASVPAVEATVERVKAAGARGARMMGGGFGGVVLALFPPGAQPPDDASALRPAAGARLIG